MTSANPRIVALFGGDLLFGQERANLEVLDALREAGACVALITRRDDTGHIELLRAALDARGFFRVDAPFFDLTKKDGLASAVFGTVCRMAVASYILARTVRLFRATHIYVFNVRLAVNFLPYLYLSRLPLIYRAGDVPPLHNRLWKFVWRFIRLRVSHFVSNSKYIGTQLIGIGVDASRLRVIYSRPPSRLPVSRGQALQLPHFISPNGPNVLYVGQLTREKGLDVLIQAIRLLVPRITDVRLIVLGRLDHEQDAFARQRRDEVSADPVLRNRVVFTGFTEDVRSAFQVARVHAAPSIWEEPLANTVLEAKDAALPSVVFSSGGLPEVVRHGIDGAICAEKTPSALAAALLPYLEDAQHAKAHGAAARKSLKELEIHRFADKWRRVFDSDRQ